MQKEGLVRVVAAGVSGEAGLVWYEATQLGVADHHSWVREPAVVPHALRDSLQAKLEFVEPEDLPSLRKSIREEEKACTDEYQRVHRLLREAQRARIHVSSQAVGWEQKRHETRLGDEAVLWELGALRLRKAHEQLVELEQESKGEQRERGDRG